MLLKNSPHLLAIKCCVLLMMSNALLLGQEVKNEPMRFVIRHYQVVGANKLPRIDVESAVYPFMGSDCSEADIERARKSLETAYQNAGYKTVSVSIPPQDVSKGYVKLQVSEGGVQRLRVRGARYFDPSQIKAKAGSLQEGQVPNFNDVTKEIVALNKNPDRLVLPELKPTGKPGEFDVDLKVKDRLPLHGTVELNNRNSPNTTSTRLNLGLSYANLWQKGHTIGANMQIAPERKEDGLVYSGYYLIPLNDNGMSLMLMGTKQDSDISTLGGAAVRGKGHVLGARLNFPLEGTSSWKPGANENDPPVWTQDNFFHSMSIGFDYKHFTEDLSIGPDKKYTPIDYLTANISYGAGWVEKRHSTDLNALVTIGTRGVGSDSREFDNKRYLANGGFATFRGDISHTHDLAKGVQVFAKGQGQWGSQPLINNEQYSGGGLGNARGYLESTVLGDNALFGTLEVRTPNLLQRWNKSSQDNPEPSLKNTTKEWRFHAFLDGGVLTLNEPLPEQNDYFELLSVGLGTRVNLHQRLQGSVDAGYPLRAAGDTDKGDWRVSFRVWTQF
jgi:hemolysin activation/secretion protein